MMEYARGLLVMEIVMKVKMWNYFSANSTQNYIKVLNDMVHNSNNKVNSSIKLTRTEASGKNKEAIVCENLFADLDFAPICFKFNVGDRVRIVKKKKAFEKEYIPRWTEEGITVSKQQYIRPPTYKMRITIVKIFRARFMTRSSKRRLRMYVEFKKLSKEKGNKTLVNCKGYRDEFNSWLDKGDLIDL